MRPLNLEEYVEVDQPLFDNVLFLPVASLGVLINAEDCYHSMLAISEAPSPVFKWPKLARTVISQLASSALARFYLVPFSPLVTISRGHSFLELR